MHPSFRPCTHTRFYRYALLIALPLLWVTGCSTHTVKTTQATPVIQEHSEIPNAELLDVGIYLFNPGLDNANDDDQIIFPEIRNAESRFMAFRLMETLQTSSAWGAVRVIPATQNAIDVTVAGVILQSDGEQLKVRITVKDATGRQWFEKDYNGVASKYAYTKQRTGKVPPEPFQNLYNLIANDMLNFRRSSLDGLALRTIRTTAELKFAQDFSPSAFGGHLNTDSDGELKIVRLPAENDPMLQRIRQIRERDYLFVDTLQDYYGSFVKEMDKPYKQWRGQSYNEVVALRELQREALVRKIAGIATVIGGIAASGSSNSSGRAAGSVAVAGGAYMIKSGFDKSAESEMHIEALQELGDSLEAAIEPQVIELEDRTITLSGTVENQYDQWRELLKEIYKVDTGGI